ncbi:hypothetical protein FHX74_000845 [Friedmanniella endophytica]|uniref:GH26 domain-containing protein n=1 Tax=Microlunatus kandeliicorticis TaxID=1759536 RepID=A0A7W3IQ84_9ACTN|nr:glycosyl hydrolase [Microlunatus kandeliicorticis]MBA8793251.1 hypothetical protein [Microlunatus kandeliicorticis]
MSAEPSTTESPGPTGSSAHAGSTDATKAARLPFWRRPRVLAVVVALVLAVTAGSVAIGRTIDREAVEPVPSVSVTPIPGGVRPGLQRARTLLGTPPSGSPWFSGAWVGGGVATAQRYKAFGTWRGKPLDAATTYPASGSWSEISESNWHISTFNGFPGVLVYGLPMLPTNDPGDFDSIVRGEHDDVYRQVAKDLLANQRGRAIVRIGWEANGDWFPWNTRASQAAAYRNAFRHIVGVLRSVAPDLVIDFDLACGTKLRGQDSRTDALTDLYPGDDVVDLVGCDTYDWYNTITTDDATWARTQHPSSSVGIGDVAAFARAHGKGLSVPEWGLADPSQQGRGDNPLFIERMRGFFEANQDILVLESYFSEPETSIRNSIYDPVQNPASAAAYRRLWG